MQIFLAIGDCAIELYEMACEKIRKKRAPDAKQQ